MSGCAGGCRLGLGESCAARARNVPRYCQLVEAGTPGYAELVRQLTAEGPAPAAPTLLGKAVAFAGSVIAFAGSGFATAGDAATAGRLATCGGCEHHSAARNTCAKCGCNLALKASWAAMECPIGKWGKVDPVSITPEGPAR